MVDVSHFNDKTWFDRAGNFHSDALHVVERYTPRQPNVLNYEATIEDPKVFTRPWKISFPLYRRLDKNTQFLEFKCVPFSEELVYGHLRKQPASREGEFLVRERINVPVDVLIARRRGAGHPVSAAQTPAGRTSQAACSRRRGATRICRAPGPTPRRRLCSGRRNLPARAVLTPNRSAPIRTRNPTIATDKRSQRPARAEDVNGAYNGSGGIADCPMDAPR